MDEFSILIGGRAGDGINQASLLIARIFNQAGWRAFLYYDYPSLIKGGHNFSIIRVSKKRINCHKNRIEILLALNQDTVNFHKNKLADKSLIIYDSDVVKTEDSRGRGVALGQIIKEEKAPPITRNTGIIGGLAKATGISWGTLEKIIRREIRKETEANLKVARRGYESATEFLPVEKINQEPLPFLTGNEAVALGLIRAGLQSYVSYPMTPSSAILHTLANWAKDFGLKVIHPENEIAVILMALGFAYAGNKSAVGTSGGGFCLMTEGFSLAGMAEIPLVVVLGQRPGPSTGLPTYSCQSELLFALNAGQGEFLRIVVAPGDAEEAYYWSGAALNFAWKYQTPAIILTDKNMAEGSFNFDLKSTGEIKEEQPVFWDKLGQYKRYLDTQTGISPLAFVPEKNAVIKVNSYEHDQSGITTEEPDSTGQMQEKRLRKTETFLKELESFEAVKVYGNKNSKTAILCWGSNKGVCLELAEKLGLAVIQPLVLGPFPVNHFKKAVGGVEKIICVENNATGQLVQLLKIHGFTVQEQILRYDGRPFVLEELEAEFKRRGLL